MKTLNIVGRTYPVRDRLKKMGCRWDAAHKCWTTTSQTVYDRAMELVLGEGPAPRRVSAQSDRCTKIEDIRIEYPSRGATYCTAKYGVYRYDTYPRHSVLAGQQRRQFIDTFDTLEEAKAEYPQAELVGCGYQPPYLGHLPDPDGPDPMGEYMNDDPEDGSSISPAGIWEK